MKLRFIEDPGPCPKCDGTRSHDKGACDKCGWRPCAYCEKHYERRWSPPELGGFFISVCQAHYDELARERRDNVTRKVGQP